jgi:hypothetical protein
MNAKFGRWIAAFTLTVVSLPSRADNELFFDRHWDKCILQSNSRISFEEQNPKAYSEGISRSTIGQIDSEVKQELSRHFVLNDPDSDLWFFYKAELRGYVPNSSLIVLIFCKRGQEFDAASCTNTTVFTRRSRGFSFTEFMREALTGEIAHLLRPNCTSADRG